MAIDPRTGQRRSLAARVVRKLGHYRTRLTWRLLAGSLAPWRAANAAATLRLAQRLRRPAAAPPAGLAALQAEHARYVATVSNPVHAASWEFVALLLRLLGTGAFTSVVDFGSGFTSYALRYWRQGSGAAVAIGSVDDNPAWLEKTRAFLAQAGLDAEDLYVEADYLAGGRPRPVDLLVYDYSHFDHRARFLPRLAPLLHRDSLILFDDTNWQPYSAHYLNTLDLWCWRQSLQLADLSAVTRDRLGRCAALGYDHRSGAFSHLLSRL